MSSWSTEVDVSKKVRSLLLENHGTLTVEGLWESLSRAEKAVLSGKSIDKFCAQIPGVIVDGQLVRFAAATFEAANRDSSVQALKQDRTEFKTALLHARIERLLQETGNSCNELLELAREEANIIVAQAQAEAALLARERQQWEEEKVRIAQTFPLQLGNPPIVLQIGEFSKGPAVGTPFAVLLSGRHRLPVLPDGSLFLDRDGAAIPILMQYLRNPTGFVFRGSKRLAELALLDADYYMMPEDYKQRLQWTNVACLPQLDLELQAAEPALGLSQFEPQLRGRLSASKTMTTVELSNSVQVDCVGLYFGPSKPSAVMVNGQTMQVEPHGQQLLVSVVAQSGLQLTLRAVFPRTAALRVNGVWQTQGSWRSARELTDPTMFTYECYGHYKIPASYDSNPI